MSGSHTDCDQQQIFFIWPLTLVVLRPTVIEVTHTLADGPLESSSESLMSIPTSAVSASSATQSCNQARFTTTVESMINYSNFDKESKTRPPCSRLNELEGRIEHDLSADSVNEDPDILQSRDEINFWRPFESQKGSHTSEREPHKSLSETIPREGNWKRERCLEELSRSSAANQRIRCGFSSKEVDVNGSCPKCSWITFEETI